MYLTKRKIESFELTPEYYEESFTNGNKKHVAEELAELYLYNFSFFQEIVMQLPEKIRQFVFASDAYLKAHLQVTSALNRIK